jgi:hypothetical protein
MEKLIKLSNDEVRALGIQADEVWRNNQYRVAVIRNAGKFEGRNVVRLSIKRHDDAPIHSWSDFQSIKNQVVDENCEGVELYPAKSRYIDQLNRYHLWVISDPSFLFPIGWNEPAASFDNSIVGKIDEED